MRLIVLANEEENSRVQRFKKLYKRSKFIKYIALCLYVFLPIWETPGWCINNKLITDKTYC